MEDVTHRTSSVITGRGCSGQRAWSRSLLLLAVSLVVATCAGCSLFVMAGKMLLGDPTITSHFETMTGVNLAESKKKLLVVCSSPMAVEQDFPSLKYDLLTGVTRRLKLNGIQVVNSDKVADWLNDNGGYWSDPSELARNFEADYIVHIDLNRFTHKEENSPNLFRGRAEGQVAVFEVRNVDGRKEALQVFVKGFRSVYPELYPISREKISKEIFGKRVIDHVSQQLASLFYDRPFSQQF